ncbi:MAG: aminotransferase class IV [Anaerolineae bacterium]|nr:aminotransferase class IV [Anaerolineae bacterium]
MIQTWQITPTQGIKLSLDATSLDSVTRQLPDGYYSTFRTYDECTRVLGLKSHLRRLYDPVSTPEVNASELRRGLITLLEPFRPDEARVRVIMTKQGQLYVAIEPLTPLPPEIYDNGVRVETTEMQRHSPRLKSTAFIGTSEAERKHIAQEGIFEALLVKNGRILEGMTSNFFYVKDTRAERSDERSSRSVDEAQVAHQTRASSTGLRLALSPSAQRDVLYTAQRDVLLGVTRRTVIRLAQGRGLEVKYQPLKLDQISDVREAFITSSSRGVVPVIQIDEATIEQGRPRQITRMLMSAYDEYVLEHAEKI